MVVDLSEKDMPPCIIELDYNSKQGKIDVNVGLEAILCLM